LANMICSPWLEGSFIAEFRCLDGLCENAQPTSLGKT
jgi:hypothetical protein